MNFVISNVETVNGDDWQMAEQPTTDPLQIEEPLSPSKKKKKPRKICFVPFCPNSTRTTKTKLFVAVPSTGAKRQAWLNAVAYSKQVTAGEQLYCCEDHFHPNDFDKMAMNEAMSKATRTFSVTKPALPRYFLCKQFVHIKRKDRIGILASLHAEKKHLQPTLLPKPYQTKRVVTKSIYIEMPPFENEDHPDLIDINNLEAEIAKTEKLTLPIVIDDDSE